jgi:hypothetical protein
MTMKTAYELLTEAAHRAGEKGCLAEQRAFQLAKGIVSESGMKGLAECAEMLTAEANKRWRGGLIAHSTSLFMAARYLLNQQ